MNERGLPRYPVLGVDTEVVLTARFWQAATAPGPRPAGAARGAVHEVLSAIAVIEPDAPAAVHSALSLSR